jgi:hypothetical protein
VAEALEAGARELERLGELAGSRGARFALAALPTIPQVMARDPRGEGYDLELPQRRLRQICEWRGWPYLDLLGPLREAARESEEALFVPGDTHLTDAGHARVAEALVDFVRSGV